MNHQKTFKLEIKDFGGEPGTFSGLASTYGNKDLTGDVVEPGAFTKTISDKGGEVPILWQHDQREPIGKGVLIDSGEGLHIKGELVLDSPVAQKAYALMKKGVLKGLSIGYDTVRDEVKSGVRYLKEIKLWEVSLVTFPANELAGIYGIKNIEDARILLAEFLAEQKTKFEALHDLYAAALKAPMGKAAAGEDEIAPEIFHANLDRISTLLRRES